MIYNDIRSTLVAGSLVVVICHLSTQFTLQGKLEVAVLGMDCKHLHLQSYRTPAPDEAPSLRAIS